MKMCVEVARDFVKALMEADSLDLDPWIEKFQQCSDFPKYTQQVRPESEQIQIEQIIKQCPFGTSSILGAEWIHKKIQEMDMNKQSYKKTKQVWQWRAKDGLGRWQLFDELRESAPTDYAHFDHWQKHAGPFEVEE